MQHESLPRPVTTAPAAIKPVQQPGRRGSSGQCVVSVLVSFTPVRRRSPVVTGSGLRSSRTVADAGERRSALLESVLGATPQEFESPILRHADQGKHRPSVPAGSHFGPAGFICSSQF
jgi:hypothetical protein